MPFSSRIIAPSSNVVKERQWSTWRKMNVPVSSFYGSASQCRRIEEIMDEDNEEECVTIEFGK